jgi:hypothetical protein
MILFERTDHRRTKYGDNGVSQRAVQTTRKLEEINQDPNLLLPWINKDFLENRIPTILVRFCDVIIRKAGMQESHESAFSLFLECHRDRGFLSQGFP